MQRKLLWTIAVLLIVALAAFYILGGFNEAKLEVTEVNAYKVAGNYYEGIYERDTIAALFFKSKGILDAKILSGDLTVINFGVFTEDSVHMVVGILLEKQAVEIPEGIEVIDIKGGKMIRATIESHNVVMPTREKIEAKIEKFASENELSVADTTIERYVADDKLIIEKFIKR